jgi:hypothetical protein
VRPFDERSHDIRHAERVSDDAINSAAHKPRQGREHGEGDVGADQSDESPFCVEHVKLCRRCRSVAEAFDLEVTLGIYEDALDHRTCARDRSARASGWSGQQLHRDGVTLGLADRSLRVSASNDANRVSVEAGFAYATQRSTGHMAVRRTDCCILSSCRRTTRASCSSRLDGLKCLTHRRFREASVSRYASSRMLHPMTRVPDRLSPFLRGAGRATGAPYRCKGVVGTSLL